MEMRELIDERTTNLIINLLAWGLPLAGIVVGALAGAARKRLASDTVSGFVIGCAGVFNWLLWHLYNAITNRYGLDTVKNLLINLGLFLAIGVAIGGLGGLWARTRQDT